MKRLERLQDQMQGLITYELDNGRYLTVDSRLVNQHGLRKVFQIYGIEDQISIEQVKVMRRGKIIGSVPGDFDPASIKSNNYFYDPRPEDFVREDDHWIASNTLGPGDLESVEGFVWE